MNNREQFEAWLEENLGFVSPWEAWQESRRQTIEWIQAASREPVALPGAIVLPGDFFKGK